MAIESPSVRVVDHERVESAFRADVAPRATVAEGERVRVRTRSLHTHGGFDRSRDYLDLSIPLTGPLLLPELSVGERIRVDIHDIRIENRGALVTLPGRGGFGADLETAGLSVAIEDGVVRFADDLLLPVRPMVGKIGLAVPGEAPGSSTVGDHGGNLDCSDLTAGATIQLTAQVAGGLLYVGDLHACQGDGECALTGVEVEGEIELSWRRIPDAPVVSSRPLVLTPDGRVLTIGDAPTLDEAVRIALDDMLALVVLLRGWPREKAAMLLSAAADVGICQLVNPRLSAKVALRADYLAPSPVPAWLTPATAVSASN